MTSGIEKSVPEDDLPNLLRSLLSAAQSFENDLGYLSENTTEAHGYCIDALSIIEMMDRLGNFGLELPELTGDEKSDIHRIWELVRKIESSAIQALAIYGTEEDRAVIARESVDQVYYEFTDDDFERIQRLINELRRIVTRAKSVDDEHRERLLKRLEKLQFELHKRVNNFDKAWGLLGDAGAAIGKFGEDTKPFVDRIRELFEIIKRTQSKGTKSLETDRPHELPPSEDSNDN